MRSITSVLSVLILIPSLGLADGLTTPLTWQDCVRQAALRNPQLLSALVQERASKAQYSGSYNGILPQLNLTHSYSQSSSDRPTLLTDGTTGTVTSRSHNWQAQATASLDLIDFGQWASIQNAAAVLRQNAANLQLASSTVLQSLYTTFAGLLYAQEEIQVASSIRDLRKTSAQTITLRYDSGTESKGNSMQTQAQYLQADLQLAQAKRNLRVAQQQLGQTLGIDSYTVLVVTGTWTAVGPNAEPPDFDPYINALPTVRVQQAVIDQAKAAVSSARSSLLPTLSLNYSRGYEGATEFPNNPYWTFTGLLSYPLFRGGPTATYYATTSAQRNLEKAEQDMRTIRLRARVALESAWSALAQAQDEVKIQRAFLDSAIQRKQESDITYQSGLLSYQDWQTITSDYVNFQNSFLSSEQNLLAAAGQWRFATGQQLGE
jgi:outer membrane protein TolC